MAVRKPQASEIVLSEVNRVDSAPRQLAWLRSVVTVAVCLLVVLPPLAIGSVYPWAYRTIEAFIFILFALWLSLVCAGKFPAPAFLSSRLRGLTLPAVLITAVAALQLLPLPPSVIARLSPSTYELYVQSLPGWPHVQPYSWIQPAASTSALTRPMWRALSIAPSLTAGWLLAAIAYVALFFIVLRFPIGLRMGDTQEVRFARIIISATLLSGAFVATIALLERVLWNGKILWTIVPYGWGAPFFPPSLRAQGPFVNPDHFGDYMALILPSAVAAAVWPEFFIGRKSDRRRDTFFALRLFCAGIAVVVFAGLALSMSRGAWMGTIVGMTVFFILTRRFTQSLLKEAQGGPRWPRARLLMAAGLVGVLIALSPLIAGVDSQQEVNSRLKTLVVGASHEQSPDSRSSVWRDSIDMVRAFPVFGVGAGSFPDLFARYRRPPWSPSFWTNAHNDYLETATDLGLVGLALMLWGIAATASRLYRGFNVVNNNAVPVVAALTAGIVAVLVHEFFDFSLRIPAVAILFAILAALALRLTGLGMRVEHPSHPWLACVSTSAVAVGSLLLVPFAFRQASKPYPFDTQVPRTPAEAKQRVLAHPALASSHLLLIDVVGKDLDSPRRMEELRAAIALQPSNPRAHDEYAQALAREGYIPGALAQISDSVAYAPYLDAHGFLDRRAIPYVTGLGRHAIKEGFNRAVDAGYPNALYNFGLFLDAIGDLPSKGEVYGRVANRQSDAYLKSELLTAAGDAFAEAGGIDQAEKALLAAIVADPSDSQSYSDLATLVYAPRQKCDQARAVIKRGRSAVADEFNLLLALSKTEEICGNADEAISTLQDAITLRPSSFDATFALADLCVRSGKLDRAIMAYRRAAEINPDSASTFFYLARAEEASFQFFAAQKDYATAVKLAPGNTNFVSAEQALKAKVSKLSAAN